MDEGERPLVNIIIYWLWTINHTLLRHYDLQMTSAILSFAVAFSPPGVAILRKTSNQNTSKTRRSKIRRARDSTTCIFAPRVARRRNSSRALILLRDSVCKVVHLFFFLWFVPVCYAVLKKWHLKKSLSPPPVGLCKMGHTSTARILTIMGHVIPVLNSVYISSALSPFHLILILSDNKPENHNYSLKCKCLSSQTFSPWTFSWNK